MVREKGNSSWSGKVREFYFESGKIDILKRSQGKLKYSNAADLIGTVERWKKHWGHHDHDDIFTL